MMNPPKAMSPRNIGMNMARNMNMTRNMNMNMSMMGSMPHHLFRIDLELIIYEDQEYKKIKKLNLI